MKKPVSVTIIAWIWIVVAIKMLLSAIRILKKGYPEPLENVSNPFKIMDVFLRHFETVGIISIIISIFIIIIAFYFLKLRAWAKTAIETISWLGLIYFTCLGIYGLFIWKEIVSFVKETNTQMGSFIFISHVATSVFVVLIIIALIVMIIFLRGKTIRDAVNVVKDK